MSHHIYACHHYSVPATLDCMRVFNILPSIIDDISAYKEEKISLATLVADPEMFLSIVIDMVTDVGSYCYSATFQTHTFDITLCYIYDDASMDNGEAGLKLMIDDDDLFVKTPLYHAIDACPALSKFGYVSWVDES